jgi:hypothetical protein
MGKFMKPIEAEKVRDYVNDNIGEFHQKRLASLDSLLLMDVLRRKNPYLYRAKNLNTFELIVRGIVDAHISSNEETLFGDWLEGLAIFINQQVFNGWKSGIPGIDLEFNDNDVRYIVSIKSGPNWANKSQVDKLKADFISAKRSLRTTNSGLNIVAVNGCCYGRENKPDKGDYFKYCGQVFWEFISGSSDLYTDIIEPLGFNARQKNDEYLDLYTKMINKFTLEFSQNFSTPDNGVDWKKLVQYNSGKNKLYLI